MRFRWLGTAGFEFQSQGETLLIDPFLTRNPAAFPRQWLRPGDFRHVGAVLVTHGHFDHAGDAPEISRVSGCRVFASPSVCWRLGVAGVPWRLLEPIKGGDSLELGPFRVEAIASRHVVFDPNLVMETFLRCLARLPQLMRDRSLLSPAGEVLGFCVEVEGNRFLHLGSAHLERGSVTRGKVDLFMVPVQGRSDITSLAARLVEEVGPRTVVPHHHDDFYPPLSKSVELETFERDLSRQRPGPRLIIPSINRWIEP